LGMYCLCIPQFLEEALAHRPNLMLLLGLNAKLVVLSQPSK
jgi:hypothetical protein